MTEFVWLADRRQQTPTVTLQLGTRSWSPFCGSCRTCPQGPLLPRSRRRGLGKLSYKTIARARVRLGLED